MSIALAVLTFISFLLGAVNGNSTLIVLAILLALAGIGNTWLEHRE